MPAYTKTYAQKLLIPQLSHSRTCTTKILISLHFIIIHFSKKEMKSKHPAT